MRAAWVLACVSVFVGGPARAGDSTASQNWPAPRFDWGGWYVGGHVAYSLGRGTSTLSNPNPISVGDLFSSLYGGVQAGYNYVFPSRLLLGAEADITFPNFQMYTDGLIFTGGTVQGTTVTDQIDYIATLRGRFGYALDHWLIYGTGGFAWSQARFVETPGVASDEDKILHTRTGWALGLGAEVAIAPDWTARIEYLYDRFGTVAGVFPSGTGYRSVFDINTLRLGLNYKLGVSDADVTAARSTDPWPIARDNWNIHGQFTFVEQGYPAFRSPYEGPNSLSGGRQAQNTVSATAFVGFRPWDGTEIYFNPEITQGFGLSTTHGIAAFPSFEAKRQVSRRHAWTSRAFTFNRRLGSAANRRPSRTLPIKLQGRRISRGSPLLSAGSRWRTSSTTTPMPTMGEHNSSTGISIAVALTTGPWTGSATPGAPWAN